MAWRHVVEEPGADEVVRVGAGLGAVAGCAVAEAPDGAHGLRESRHAVVVE